MRGVRGSSAVLRLGLGWTLLAWLLPAGASAAPGWIAEGALDEDEPRVEARLVVHPDDAPDAATVRAGVLLRMDPGWHIYWKDPGESGLPTEVHWRLEGQAGPLVWPPHQTFVEGEGAFRTNGYEGQVLLASVLRFEVPGVRSRRVEAEVELLACERKCIPATLRLERDLGADVGAGPGIDARGLRAAFAPLERDEAIPDAQPSARAQEAGPRTTSISWLHALLLAFLGGLILNGMPCVLPVLAIKVCAVAELAHRNRREVILQGIAYTAGILASMGVLGAGVIALRAAGHSVGWGFQFQEPRFVAAVAAVVVLFALNLFGAFEIGLGAGRLAGVGAGASGLRRSFLEGLLAVLLATPCTAPFLGTAAGFAFAAPAALTLVLFGAIGLGLAAPFLCITWVPGWARWIPRPGGWMLRLRALLGFGLLFTAVWLVWIFGRLTGSDAVALLLAALLALSFLAWLYGVLQPHGWRALDPLAVGVLLLLLGVGHNAITTQVAASGADATAEPGDWRPYSREQLVEVVEGGRPALVVFTADWCLTCKLNERNVLADPRIETALRRRHVALFRADWTRRDEAIRAELARFGRAGVPMTLFYRAGAPAEPVLLPELLTVPVVLEALGAAQIEVASPLW